VLEVAYGYGFMVSINLYNCLYQSLLNLLIKWSLFNSSKQWWNDFVKRK